MADIKTLTAKIKKFRDARDRKQFHNHKDLAISLVLEAAEFNAGFSLVRRELSFAEGCQFC